MKYVIVTDTHLGYKGGSDVYHEICLLLFRKIAAVATERGIDTLIHGGDFFNTRKAISLKSIPVAYEILDILKKTFARSYLIVGNHDIYYKSQIKPTSLQMFENHDKITIVDAPMVVGNTQLHPWIIDEFVPLEADYIIGHFEMMDIVMNRAGTLSKSGLPSSIFHSYKKVLSGHYHTVSGVNNIKYLGAPYHMDFNDDGPRGFYIFDDDGGDLEFIEFSDYPKFKIFNYKSIKYDEIQGNNVKVIVTEDIGTTKVNALSTKVSGYNPNQMFIEFSFSESFDNSSVSQDDCDIVDLRTIEKKYLDKATFPEYIKREELEKHLDSLWLKLKEK